MRQRLGSDIHHQAQANADPVANTPFEQLLELEPSSRIQSSNMCLELDLGTNFAHLVHNIRVAGGELPKIANDPLSFLPTVLLSQPPWGFWAERHDCKYEDSGEKLKTERNLPLSRG